jgi:hypothetical protein
VWKIFKTSSIEPAANHPDVSWTEFLNSQAAVARDFFTVDTTLVHRCYVLIFIHVPTRQVFHAGITANPTGQWTAQALRNLFSPPPR